MRGINQLIAEMCSEGVEFKTLGEAGQFVRGNGLQKKDLLGEGVGAIHYGQVFTTYGTSTSSTKSFVSTEMAAGLRRAKPGDLVIATTSENDEDVCKAVAWLGDDEIAVSGDAFIYSHTLDPLYAAYFFQAEAFQSQKRRFISGTKVKRVSGTDLARIKVPVPPRAIQREIASLLVEMESLKAELEGVLHAELEYRSRQYAFYRDKLLTFRDTGDVRRIPLGDVAEYVNGKAHEKLVTADGDVPLATARFISRNGEANRFVPHHDVLTPVLAGDVALVLSDLPNGRALARTYFVDRDDSVAINQRIARLRVLDRTVINPRFLFHVLDRNPGFLAHDNGVDQTHLSKGQVVGLPIPVPPLDEQQRIVAILDKFDNLVNNLSVGLPAEIAARRKQYEYYRDKLLTFKATA